MQRRRREHHAQPREPRRHAWQRVVAAGAFAQQHDRALARFKRGALGIVQVGERLCRRGIGQQHRERLLLALLALAQPGHRLRVARIAREMKTTDALDCDDLAAREPRDYRRQRVEPCVEHRTVGRAQAQTRPADRTCIRLGMEAPVGRRFVLAAAVGAQHEGRHRRVRPVVGQAARDRVARSAVRAVDERIPPAPVFRGEELVQAVRAHGGVGRDGGRDRPATTRLDDEGDALLGRLVARLQHRDACERGWLATQSFDQRIDRRQAALRLDLDALRVVAHPTDEPQLARQPPHVRPETHALHLPSHANAAADDARRTGHGHRRRLRHAQALAAALSRGCSAACSIQSSHASMPSPRVADTGITSIAGLMRRADSMQRTRSKST